MTAKPDVLVLTALTPESVVKRLSEKVTLHRTYGDSAEARAALLLNVGSSIRAIVTGGVAGAPADLLAKLPHVELIAVNGVGVDAVALDVARDRGIVVTTTPGVLTDDVADLALLLAMSVARRLPALDRYARDGSWPKRRPMPMGSSLAGKVAGIYGYGQIGRAVASRLAACGMLLCYYQPRPVANADVPRKESLLALADASDYLVVCAPGGPATLRSVNGDVLRALGPAGVLINVARGSLVDEAALVRALEAGYIAGAGLDVFVDEPNVSEGLKKRDNVVLTPHAASFTHETRGAMSRVVADNVLRHFGLD